MKRFQMVEVYWVDSHILHGWVDGRGRAKHANKLGLLCCTVGMLVKKNKKRIIITQSISLTRNGDIDNVAETLIIPMCAVKKINKL